MTINKLLSTISLIFFIQMGSFGQYILPDFQSQIVQKNDFLVRWEPRTLDEWNHAQQNGYTVEIYSGSSLENLTLTTTDTIRPAAAAKWDVAINALNADTLLQNFYAGAKELLYPAEGDKAEMLNMLEKEEGKSLEQTVDEFYMGYLVYGATYDYGIIQLAGLGYDIALKKGQFYKIIAKTGDFKAYEFIYNPNKKQLETLGKLMDEFGDKKVKLTWNTREYRDRYFGYYLEVSDNGKDYQLISDVPYINILDTISASPETHFLNQEIVLEKNYKNYWFRLRGMNYFGIKTKKNSVIKGFGFENIPGMPIIQHSEQTPDNEAFIKWKFDEKYNRLIESFALYRADSLEGEFVPFYENIPPQNRMVKAPMTEPRNFFSLVIVPKNGPVIKSFPVFIMGQDTIPPITPLNFEGEIDSLGIVTLTWTPNEEPDLWGYKVFRSEFIDQEFVPMFSSPSMDTIYRDTVNLNVTNEEIHYSLIALDKRNNRSPFTHIITLERPDTIPPTPPLVREVKFMEDSIQVIWAPSSSDDVVGHRLFKKEIDDEGWELFATIDTPVSGISTIIDTTFALNKTYAYTAMAIDDDSLSSLPSRVFVVQTKSRKPKKAFKSFDISFDEEEQLSTIKWNLLEENSLAEIIVYRGKTAQDITMLEILNPEEILEFQQPTKEKEEWFFIFNPIFKDGSISKMSEVIKVTHPE